MEAPDRDRPWASEIEPFLKSLYEQLKDQQGSSQSASLIIGRESLKVRPQELRMLTKLATQDEEPVNLWDQLALDSVGFQMKVLVCLNGLIITRGDDDASLGQLIQDLELGGRLARRLTTEMHVLRENKQIGEANRLSDSRMRLDEVLRVAEKGVREVSPEQDDGEKNKFVYDWDSMVDPEEVKRRAKEALAKRQVEQKKEKKRSTQSKVILAATAVAALVISVSLSWFLTVREVVLEPFSPEQFNDWYGIEQVVNRPPQIMVIVTQERWDQLEYSRKKLALEEAVELVRPAGYKLVEIRSLAKGRLAKWQDGKVEVLE
jgi:hypothetical protein